MAIHVQGNNGTGQVTISVNELPDKCPYCHKSIRPIPCYAANGLNKWSIMFKCPNSSCQEVFLGYYEIKEKIQHGMPSPTFLNKISIGNLMSKDFSVEVNEISPGFVKIYNEAYSSEQFNLLEICGVGYRKALEFLIKDYAIKNHPNDKAVIEKKLLGSCINDYVTDERIKNVAKRAAWLGNDETHFVRKWEDKNLDDLKKLIDLTIHWIVAEVITASFEVDMPE